MNQLLFNFFYQLAVNHPWLGAAAVFSAVYLGWVALVCLALLFLWRQREDSAAGGELFFILTTGGASWFVSYLIKLLWFSPRPVAMLEELKPLLEHGDSAAFPSSHAAFFFAIALAAHVVDARLGRWMILVAILVSVARVAVGVHWPSDILGGFALAIFISLAAGFVARLIHPAFGHKRG